MESFENRQAGSQFSSKDWYHHDGGSNKRKEVIQKSTLVEVVQLGLFYGFVHLEEKTSRLLCVCIRHVFTSYVAINQDVMLLGE